MPRAACGIRWIWLRKAWLERELGASKSARIGLRRCLGAFGAILLTLSSITPASSVFAIIPGAITQAGTGVFAAMILAAILSIPIAYIYAELASAFPIAGGEYCIVGRILGPAAGASILGLTVFSSILSPAALALGASTYIAVIFPSVDPALIAICIISVVTALAVLRIQTNAWLAGACLLLELSTLMILFGSGLWNQKRSLFEIALHPVWLHRSVVEATPITAIGLAGAICVFAYDGAGSAIYFSEEIRQVPRVISRVILWSLAVTILAELLPTAAVLLGASNLGGLLRSENPFVSFVSTSDGPFLTVVVSLGVTLAIFAAVLATILQNARFLYCTGRDGVWPQRCDIALTNVHSKFGSPWIATLVAGCGSLAACFLGMNLILVLTGTSIVIVYLVMWGSVIYGRLSGITKNAHYRMPYYPLMLASSFVALGYILYASIRDPNVGYPSLLSNIAVIAASLGYYYVILKRRGEWTLKDPPSELPRVTG